MKLARAHHALPERPVPSRAFTVIAPTDRKKKDKVWQGIYRHGAGWRAVVSQGDKPQVTKHFPLSTLPRAMQDWRQDTIAKLRLTRKARMTMGAFRADALRYLKLKAVIAMPTFEGRERHINFWIEQFGDRQRDTITKNEIEDIYIGLLTDPRSETDTRPLAIGTANLMLGALSNLYTRLDDVSDHVVRKVEEKKSRKGHARQRAIPYQLLHIILSHMADQGRAAKGQRRPTFSETKIRLRCLAYCQICRGQLMQITREDIDFDNKTLALPDREKGDGADPIVTPLTDKAVAAFREFDQHDLYGDFSGSSMWKSFNLAARKAGVTHKVQVHGLRHTVLSMLGETGGDEKAVQVSAQHGSMATTAIYTKASIDPRVKKAFAAYNAYLEALDAIAVQ